MLITFSVYESILSWRLAKSTLCYANFKETVSQWCFVMSYVHEILFEFLENCRETMNIQYCHHKGIQYIHIFDLMPTRAHSLYNIMILCFMLIFELLLRSNKLSCRSTGKRWNVEFVIIWFLSIFQKLVKYLTKAHQISHFSISHSTIHKKHRKKCKLCKFCKLCKLCCR